MSKFISLLILFVSNTIIGQHNDFQLLSEKERAKLHYQSDEYVQVAMGHRDVMELGGNLFEGALPVEAGEDIPAEVSQQVVSARG